MRDVQRVGRICHSGRIAGQKRRFRGILTFVPGRYGIGVVGPALNDKGNSYAGVHLLQTLSRRWTGVCSSKNPLKQELMLQGMIRKIPTLFGQALLPSSMDPTAIF